MENRMEPIQTFEEFQIGSYKLNTTTRMLTRNDISKKLSKTDTNLLAYFCANNGVDIKRGDCLKAVWGEDTYKNLRSMDVFMCRLRKYLKDDNSIYLINLHAKGYRFIF
jgi:DNA-binding response OmpR family regulator